MRKEEQKRIKTWITIIFFFFILLDIFFVSRNILFGVKLKNINIIDGYTYEGNLLKITGNAKNALTLSLNSHEIPIDEGGNFEETISLSSGYNIITIEAKDKFGKSDKKTFHLIGGSAKQAEL